jgi:hypothetical protein
MKPRVSRRTFLKTATAAAYAACLLPAWSAVDRGAVAMEPPLSTFAYSAVQLLGGPMKRQFDENHARFLNLDDDRLLKVFRQVAGLPAPGRLVRPHRVQPGAQRLSRLCPRPQFWTISLWTRAGLRSHGIGANSTRRKSGAGRCSSAGRRSVRPQSRWRKAAANPILWRGTWPPATNLAWPPTWSSSLDEACASLLQWRSPVSRRALGEGNAITPFSLLTCVPVRFYITHLANEI